MPSWLKSTLRALAYFGFFLVALCAFVYFTLPLDALNDYLVRKASDEYSADLEITELSMWGLSGLEMEGVTLTPRPTPEELAEMQEAREARAAWQARQKAKSEAAEAQGDLRETDPTVEKGLAALPPGAIPEGGPPPETVPIAGPTVDAAKKKAEAEKDEPPPIPPGPQPLYIENMRAKLALGKLVSDLMDGKVFNEDAEAELEMAVLGGTVQARVDRTAEQMAVKADLAGLDLRQLTVLRGILPLPIVGDFQGQVDVEVPLDETGGFRIASTAGHLNLSISSAVIGPGRIESDKLRNFGGFFDVPRLRMESFGGGIKFERRRATFDEFAFRGKDLEGDISGYVQLANKLERFNPRAYLRFKFGEEFLEREKGIGVLMRTVPEIKRGTGNDGFTGFAVSMKTDRKTKGKRLSWRPTPRNPYGPRTTSRRGSAGEDGPKARPDRKSKVRPGRDALRDRKKRRARKPLRGRNKAKPSTAAAAPPDEPPETAAKPDEDEPETEEEVVEGDSETEEDEEGGEGEGEEGAEGEEEEGAEEE